MFGRALLSMVSLDAMKVGWRMIKGHSMIGGILIASLLQPVSAFATELTGAIIFATPSPAGHYANTYGGDTYSFNGYLLNGLPVSSFGNAFLNSGNLTTTPTRISINLSSPGTYSFTMLDDASLGDTSVSPSWGLNLFFNGNDTVPRISVFGEANNSSAAFVPAFAANSSAATATLNPLTLGTAPGSGSLSWVDGGLMVALTYYRHSTSSIFGVDLVSGFDTGASGFGDAVTEFTLNVSNVSAVPEPSALILLSAGIGSLAFVRFVRRGHRFGKGQG